MVRLQRHPVYLDVLISSLRARKLLYEAKQTLSPTEFASKVALDWNELILRLSAIDLPKEPPMCKVTGSSIGKMGKGYVRKVIIPFLLFHTYILRVSPVNPKSVHDKVLAFNNKAAIIPEHNQRLTIPFYGSFYERAYSKAIPLPWVSLLFEKKALTISPIDDKPTAHLVPPRRPLLKDKFAYYYVRTTASMSRKERKKIKTGNRVRKYRAKKMLRKERSRLRLIRLIQRSNNTARNILRLKFGEEKYYALLEAAQKRNRN